MHDATNIFLLYLIMAFLETTDSFSQNVVMAKCNNNIDSFITAPPRYAIVLIMQHVVTSRSQFMNFMSDPAVVWCRRKGSSFLLPSGILIMKWMLSTGLIH